MSTAFRILTALVLILPAATNAEPPSLQVVLKPHRAGSEVDYIDVRLVLEAPDARPDTPLLRIPRVFASIESVRYEADDIRVSDANGPVPLVQKDDPTDAAGFIYFRRWMPTRVTVGDVTVAYRAPTRVFRPKLGSGPPFDLRPEAGGVNGAGVSFLVLPDRPGPWSIHLKWDLSDMPPGSRGAWSLGEGEVRTVGPVELLAHAYYMAGSLHSHPESPGQPFQIYWQSEPPFDAKAVAEWTGRAYSAISAFFGEPGAPYRVFFRKNPYSAMGGAGLVRSFMLGYGSGAGEAPTVGQLSHTLAHEIVHNWPGSLNGPNGIVSWYGEGMAEHYAAVLTWRAGLMDTEQYLADVNRRALSYYSSAVNRLPAEQIAARFWTDARVRRLPYDRGSLYLATVDAQVRAVSGGKRRLDDLTHAMLARRKRGESYDTAAWLDLVTRELGPGARAEFDAMMAGELVVPPSDAFGPCFRRENTRYRRFELGFDPASLTESPRIVRGVVAGSAAARAGLKDGDEITTPVVLEPVQRDPAMTLTLHVRREGKDIEITYLPRGEAVDGYRWVRVESVPDSACDI